VLRLTLLGPHIVEAILNGRQRAEVASAMLMQPFVEWAVQRRTSFCPKDTSVMVSRPPAEMVVQSRSSIDRASGPF
jgi:hypothetical protein